MRLLREKAEAVTEKVPEGPLGFTGNGKLFGGATFFALSALNGVNPLDDIDVGYNIESSSVKRYPENDLKEFEFVINAASKDVAKFVAVFKSRSSIVGNLSRTAEVLKVEKIKERRWMSDWRIVVETRSVAPDQ
jgi:hypothetical protein